MTILITILILLALSAGVTNQWQTLAPKKFEISRQLDKERVTVGDKVKLTTTMVNKKSMPLPWVSVYTSVPQSFVFDGTHIVHLTPDRLSEYNIVTSFLFYEQVKRHDYFTCEKRGYYKLEAPVITFGDLFGFSKVEKTYPVDRALYVYPKVKPLSDFKLRPNTQQGPISVKRWIMPDPIQVIGSRAYTHNDSFNTIDWKSTAKLGQLHVKKMDHTAEHSLTVFLDVQTSKMHWNEIDRVAIENGVDISAALLQEAFNQKIPVGFCANSVDAFMRNAVFYAPSSAPSQRTRILDALAMVMPFRGLSMDKLMRSTVSKFKSESVIVLITGFLSIELTAELNKLSNRGYTIKVISTKSHSSPMKLVRKIEMIQMTTQEEGVLL